MPEAKLDTFEIDDSNKFAVALCKALVNLEKGYSPLLIHGEPGSGKTHLLTAVTTEISLAHPEIALLFIAEDVPVEKLFGESNGGNGDFNEAFSRELGRKDFLVIDDLERFAEVPDVHEKFSALFSTFVDSGKQILLASTVPIKDLRGFDKRLISRLRGGIDVHLSPPRPETRLKILKNECARLGLQLDVGIMQMLMREAGKNALYLKRLPGHLKTFATLNRQALTKEMVEEFLKVIREQVGEQRHCATTEQIFSSYVQLQAKKREDDLQAILQEHEQRARQSQQEAQKLAAREKAATAEIASLNAKLKKVKDELDEKNGLLKSQGKVISGEIVNLNKELEERDQIEGKIKADYEGILNEKDAKILELEQMVERNFRDLAKEADRQKQANHDLEKLRNQMERLHKDTEDKLLALKIQLEDREQKLALLREERERRSSQQQKEKTDLEEAHEENLLLEKAVNDLNQRTKQLEKELLSAKKELAQAGEQRGSADAENERIRRELLELRERQKGETEQQANTLEKARAQAKQLQAELDEKIVSLKNLKDKAQKEKTLLQKQLDAAQASLEETERRLSETATKEKSEADARKTLETELASTSSSFDQLLKTHQAECAQLEQAVQERETRLKEAVPREQQLKQESAALSQALEEERARAHSFEQAIVKLNNRANVAEADLDTAEKKLKALANNHQRAREETERVRAERDKLKQNLSNLTEESHLAQAIFERQEKALADKNEEINRHSAAARQLREQLAQNEQALLEKQRGDAERVRKFHEQMEKRDKELQAAETELKKQEAALKETREQNSLLADQMNRMADDLLSARKEKENLEQSLSQSLQEARSDLAEKHAQIEWLQQEAGESKARADEAARQLKEEQKSAKERLEQQQKEWADREKALENRNASLQHEFQEATGIIKRLKSHVADLEDRVRQRDQLLEAKEKGEAEHVLKLKDELKRRNDDLEQLIGNLAATNEKADGLERKTAELSRELTGLKEEKEQAGRASAAALDVFEKQLSSTKEQASLLELQLEEQGSQLVDLEKRLAERDRQIQSHADLLAAAREKLAAAESEKETLVAEKQRLAERTGQLSRENEETLEASAARLNEARQQLRDAQAREEELLARLETERLASADRLERQRTEMSARERGLADAKSAVDLEVNAVSEQLQKLKVKTEEAQHDLERQVEMRELAEQESLRLAKLVEEKELRITELQRAGDSLREDFSHKMAEGTEAKHRFLALDKEITAKERSLAAVRQDYSDLQVDYDRLKAEMSKVEKAAGKLLAEKKKAEQEMKSRDEQSKLLQEEIRSLRENVEDSHQESHARLTELERMLAEKEALLETAESRIQQKAKETASMKDEETARLTAAQERALTSLRDQVQDAMSENKNIREDYEKRLLQERNENDGLRARIMQFESGLAAHEAPTEPAKAEVLPQPEQPPSPPPEAGSEPLEEIEEAEIAPAAEPAYVPGKEIDWLHSFADFRCNEANSFTKSIAEKIAKSPAKLYNPLCLYGPPNSGKTHLLHAIGRLTTTQFPKLPSEILSLDTLIGMIESGDEGLARWPSYLRLLIIDDFDISAITAEQQTNLHALMAALLKRETQIVIASQAPPIKMDNLQPSMLQLIETGLLAKLETDPRVREAEKEAAQTIASVARAPFAARELQQQQAARAQAQPVAQPESAEKRDFLAEFLKPDGNLTIATFREKEIIEEFEEIFKNPNKRWRNKFPILVMEDDRQRRSHFFNALTHRLQGVFTGPVSYFSIERLALVVSRKQAVDWNGLLNRLIKSHVILVDDCDSVSKLPPSLAGYLRAIMEEVLGRDILLMIGMSKKYKKEPVFGPALKKGTKKKL